MSKLPALTIEALAGSGLLEALDTWFGKNVLMPSDFLRDVDKPLLAICAHVKAVAKAHAVVAAAEGKPAVESPKEPTVVEHDPEPEPEDLTPAPAVSSDDYPF